MRETLTSQPIKQSTEKTVRETLYVPKNETEHRENSARGTNVTNSQTELKENSAQDTNVTNSQTNLIQNSARDKQSHKTKYNTMHETIT